MIDNQSHSHAEMTYDHFVDMVEAITLNKQNKAEVTSRDGKSVDRNGNSLHQVNAIPKHDTFPSTAWRLEKDDGSSKECPTTSSLGGNLLKKVSSSKTIICFFCTEILLKT